MRLELVPAVDCGLSLDISSRELPRTEDSMDDGRVVCKHFHKRFHLALFWAGLGPKDLRSEFVSGDYLLFSFFKEIGTLAFLQGGQIEVSHSRFWDWDAGIFAQAQLVLVDILGDGGIAIGSLWERRGVNLKILSDSVVDSASNLALI